MVFLGFEPGASGWKAQTNPLSYGDPQPLYICYLVTSVMNKHLKCLVGSLNIACLTIIFKYNPIHTLMAYTMVTIAH